MHVLQGNLSPENDIFIVLKKTASNSSNIIPMNFSNCDQRTYLNILKSSSKTSSEEPNFNSGKFKWLVLGKGILPSK